MVQIPRGTTRHSTSSPSSGHEALVKSEFSDSDPIDIENYYTDVTGSLQLCSNFRTRGTSSTPRWLGPPFGRDGQRRERQQGMHGNVQVSSTPLPCFLPAAQKSRQQEFRIYFYLGTGRADWGFDTPRGCQNGWGVRMVGVGISHLQGLGSRREPLAGFWVYQSF